MKRYLLSGTLLILLVQPVLAVPDANQRAQALEAEGYIDPSEVAWVSEKLATVTGEGADAIAKALRSRKTDRETARTFSWNTSTNSWGFLPSLGGGMIATAAAGMGLIGRLKNPHPLMGMAVLGSMFVGGVGAALGYQWLVAKGHDSEVIRQYRARVDELAIRHASAHDGEYAAYGTVNGRAAFEPRNSLAFDRAVLVQRVESAARGVRESRGGFIGNSRSQTTLFLHVDREHQAELEFMAAVETVVRKDLLAARGEHDAARVADIVNRADSFISRSYEGSGITPWHVWQVRDRLADAAREEVDRTAAELERAAQQPGADAGALRERVARLRRYAHVELQNPSRPEGPSITMQMLGTVRGSAWGSPVPSSGSGDGSRPAAAGPSGTGDGNAPRTGTGSGSGTGSGGTDLHNEDLRLNPRSGR